MNSTIISVKEDIDCIFTGEMEKQIVAFDNGHYTSKGYAADNKWVASEPIIGGCTIHNMFYGKIGFAIVMLKEDDITYDSYIDIGQEEYSAHVYLDEYIHIPINAFKKYTVNIVSTTTDKILDPSTEYIKIFRKKINHESKNTLSYASKGILVPSAHIGSITSAGYQNRYDEIITDEFALGKNNSITVVPKDNRYRFAVYYTTNHSGWSTSGWKTEPQVLENPDVYYVVRISAFTLSDFDEQSALDAVYLKFEPHKEKKVIGYKRYYSDITSDLTFEKKSIETSGITDSEKDLLAVLPCSGNIEIKMNAPSCKFVLYKKSLDGSIKMVGSGWTYYPIRYTGDYYSTYYIRVRKEGDGNITDVKSGYEMIRVYTYTDEGQLYPENSIHGKNIAVIGDSIVQGRYAKNGSTFVNTTAPHPYSNLLAYVTGKEPNNFGIGGALVHNTNWKSLYTNCTKVTGYDIVIVAAGTNDYGNNTTESDFKNSFAYVIDRLKEQNTRVIIMSPPFRTSKTGENTVGLTLLDYCNMEKEIAISKCCEFIDLYSFTDNDEWKSYMPDGLHPNEMGHKMIADFVLANI